MPSSQPIDRPVMIEPSLLKQTVGVQASGVSAAYVRLNAANRMTERGERIDVWALSDRMLGLRYRAPLRS